MAVKAKQQEIRALLVEENDIIIDSLTEIMKSQGFHVISHKDPAQAINLMKGGSISVVIADDKCGGKEGLEILELAKQELPAATRLLLTSRVNDDLVQAAVKDRLIYRYITKPWLTEDLVLTLKTAADTYRLAEKNASLLLEKNDLERTVRDLEKLAAAGGSQDSGLPAAVQTTQTEAIAGDGDAGAIMQTMIEMLYVFHPNLKSNA
ncbi:MAG TPA: response regulator, partial [Verrucomicrobiota bacterium]|nr:response regulator [Verrucomicrobiota bacterium]